MAIYIYIYIYIYILDCARGLRPRIIPNEFLLMSSSKRSNFGTELGCDFDTATMVFVVSEARQG